MAITVDPITYVINVPRDDLALVQITPSEIRTMDLNWFRMELHNIMDDPDGMPMLKMFTHNTEVILGGITYARIIEILDPYTITFEDGQYAVNLTGANSNVADKTNVNQVSVRPQNSAGLISSADIEYGAFNGGITYDEINGYEGTGQISNGANIGTPRAPSNNMYDTRFIGVTRGFNTVYVIGNMDMPEYEEGTTDPFTVSDYTFIGSGKSSTIIDIPAIAEVNTCKYYDAHITGTLDGFNTLVDCVIDNLTYIKGYLESCVLSPGVITLGGNDTAHFLDCFSGVPGTETPTINFGGSGQSLAMRNYNGGILLENKTGPESASIDLNSGQVKIDLTTVINGTIVIRGIGKVIDTNGNELVTGYYGDLYILNEAMNQANISAAVWDEPIGDHLIPGTTGKSLGVAQFGGAVHINTSGLAGTVFPRGTEEVPVNNIADAVIIAEANGLDKIRFHTHYTFVNGDYITDYRLIGEGLQKTTLTFESGCVLANCVLEHVTGTGYVIGVTGMYDSLIYNLSSATPFVTTTTVIAKDCIMKGTTSFPILFEGTLEVLDCWGMPSNGEPPTLDMGGANFDVDFRNYSGYINIKNCTADDAGHVPDLRIMINSGGLILEPTVTTGDIIVTGVGTLEDNSTSWNSLDTQGLISQDTIAEAVWDEPIVDHIIPDTTGHQMYHAAYNGVVEVDVINGSAGTVFPTGTSHEPCNNLTDALKIANSHFIPEIHVRGLLVIDGEDISNMNIAADSSVGNTVTINSMVNTGVCYFKDLTISGSLTGSTRFTTCVLGALTGFDGGAKNSLITGDIEVTGSGANYLTECDSYVTGFTPKTISVGDNFLNLIKCRGNFALSDYTGTGVLACDFVSGIITINNTCVSGMIGVSGIVTLNDNSSAGCTVIDNTVTEIGIAEEVWTNATATTLITDVEFIKHIEGGKWKIESNQMTFYEDDNTTVVAVFDLKDASGAPTDVNVYERERV